MKLKNINKLLLVAATIAVTGVSCKKQDFSNINPDSITNVTYDFKTILPASQTTTATIMGGTTFKYLQNWMGYWARSGSYQDVTDEESYSFTNDFNAGVWNGLYGNANNYNLVIQGAIENKAGKYDAIARIMKAMDFQMLVDVYGNVPYTEAFHGLDIKTPKYDKGRDIYDSLFVELDTAIAHLKDPFLSSADQNFDIANNDLIYKGDASKWIKFANTLKLRMLVHAFQVPGFDLAGKAAVIEAEGSGFIDAGGSALINPGYTGTKPQPFYRAYAFTETGVGAAQGAIERGNAYAIGDGTTPGYYQVDGDIRIGRFYNTIGGNFKGIPYGQISGTVPGFTGDLLSTVNGPGYSPDGASSRAWIFTDFESLFLQAEAVERGIIIGSSTPKVLVRDGLAQSLAFLDVVYDPILNSAGTADSIVFTYQTSADSLINYNATYPDYDYDATGGGLYTILSQKWFALNGINPLEVWTDWRRTDVVYGEAAGFLPGPPISVNPARAPNAGIPIRLFYPQAEYNYNGANVGTQGVIDVTSAATLGTATTPGTGRIFWDIN